MTLPGTEITRLNAEQKEDTLTQAAHKLGQQGKLQEAIELFREAASGAYTSCSTWLNLGIYLHAAGQTMEGLDALRHAIRIKPDYAEAWQNMGMLHQSLGELTDAYSCFRRALVIRPDYPTARWNLALLQLLLGDFTHGFANFEQRFLRTGALPQRHFDLSRWQGEDIAGRTLLVVAEQGYGDTIQFMRYLPVLADQGIRVVVEVQDKSLLELTKAMPGVQAVVTREEPRPQADFQIPIVSLAFACGTTEENIPPAPYYVPDTIKLKKWRHIIGDVSGLKVGIVWSGSRTHKNNSARSISFNEFSTVLNVNGVTFFTLQIGADALSVEDVAACKTPLTDLTSHIHDFSDTAAFVANLDLVISVDTSTAHLAGALGRPVWVLLPFAPDWRWILGRDDSPWYPTMRLFRQQQPGEWESVFINIVALLEKTVSTQVPTNADPIRTELSLEFFLAAMTTFEKGNYVEAVSLLKKALTHNPELFGAHYLLGMTHGCLDDFTAATVCLREAIYVQPHSAPAHLLLGKALIKLGLNQDAISHLRKALELDPDSASTACTLANALSSAGFHAEGADLLESFADIGSTEPLWHFMMATSTQASQPQTALFHYSEALRLNPEYHEAGLNYAVLLLSLGMYEIGWKMYEHRIPRLGLNAELAQIRRWQGEPLTGKAILVATEQGFGDSIQFIRYAQLLKSQGAMVHVLCTNNLPVRPLMNWAVGVDSTIIPHNPIPHLDWYVPIMSLPSIFGTKFATVPGEPGYIIPRVERVRDWRKRLEPYQKLRVGLVWSGNRALNANSSRSISFEKFSSLLEVEGVTFFTLQIGADALTAEDAAICQGSLVDLTSHIHDFGDTAAFIANLDLVISVDTATAHLAGALGKPVWTLLYYPAEWRWLRGGEDTPWYPSMRLFRQDATAKWEPVLAKVKSELEKM